MAGATSHLHSGSFLGVANVPRLGIGLAALGRPGYINLGHSKDLTSKGVEEMREHCWQVLDAAHAAGVRYFDAARSYGRAEEFLSGWLQSRRIVPRSVAVGSKWGYYYTADWQTDTGGAPHEVKEHTPARLATQQEETAHLLGDHLQLYQIHSATLESGVLQNAGVLEGLERLKKERGWKIGLTLSGVQQGEVLRLALEVKASDGSRLFDSVQATWNLLEQSAGAALLDAHQAGMEVIIKEGVANGRLTSRNTAASLASRMSALVQAAERLGCTVDAVALAAVLAQPFKPMVLSGATTKEQLLSNWSALEVARRLDAETLAALQEQLKQEPAHYWGERSALAWN